MKTLIVYDSVFGNTAKVAREIEHALANKADVRCLHVDAADEDALRECQWLIIGSPTRGFVPTKPIQAFIRGLKAEQLQQMHISIFDTRMDVVKVNNIILTFMVKINGYANDWMQKQLKSKKVVISGDAGKFIVEESEGPLQPGEMERVSQWALAISEGLAV